MISDILLSGCRAGWRGWTAFVFAFLGLGLVAYFQNGSLSEAIYHPLTLLMFIVFVVVFCDLLILLFRRLKPGKPFLILFVASIFLVGVSFFYSGMKATKLLLIMSFVVAMIFLAFGKLISMGKR